MSSLLQEHFKAHTPGIDESTEVISQRALSPPAHKRTESLGGKEVLAHLPRSALETSRTRARLVMAAALGEALRSRSLLNLDNSADCWDLLLICDGLVAVVTHPHFKLEAHQRDGGALGAALAADGLPALPAVVLEGEKNMLPAPAHLGLAGWAQV